MTALITTANSIKGLIAVRSLGRRGIGVTTADKQRFALGSFSRYSKDFYTYPSPTQFPSEFIHSLTTIIEKHKQDVLMPVHSEDTYLIAKHKSRLETLIKVPLHDYSTMMQVNDKGFLMKAADDMGIRVPRTYLIDNLSSLHQIADKLDFPAVIKLRETASSIGLSYVYSKEDLISRFKETVSRFNLSPHSYPLIQEYIEGDGYGVSLLFNQGDLRAKFTHKRIREYPISGGPSTYRISVKHQKMEKLAIELLKHFNWHGVAMVEFKLDSKHKNPVLMEINPRFWGSVNQAVQSGVDFPYLLYTMAMEGDVKPVLDYKVGIKTKNIFIDYIALSSYIRKTKKMGLLKEFFCLPVNDDIFSFDDPLPMLSFIRTGLNEVIHSRYKKAAIQ
ncbi:MAG: ATP-grasp domain-containing protein [Candidatus Methanoperedens sp.]|nr:ATP-grasp domain-containing protein [Candidatus Methanoperedens sp.]MCZ7403906.1 ATP-grasp domain-containing protein [Candidatus Methanoperedens sp.]